MTEVPVEKGEGDALKAMVSFFTIWRRDITAEDMEAMDRRFHLVPLVGALFSVVLLIATTVLVYLQSEVMGSGMFTAAAILAIVYCGSRFLHFDGLADFGDGSVVSGTREDHVRALKDTLVGAGGLGVAMIVVLLSFSLYTMGGARVIALAAIAEVLVKNAQVAAAAYGQAGGGMAGRQVSETTVTSMVVSSIISLVLVLVFAVVGASLANALLPYDAVEYLPMVVAAVVGLAFSIVTGYLMACRCNRVFGMVNGDILGATNEISRVVVMFMMVLAYGLLV